MPKSSNYFGQPIYGQLIKSLDREKIVGIAGSTGKCKISDLFEELSLWV